MMTPQLSPDTQATALLVGRFGKGEAKPLTRTDFNKVALSLHQRGMRPSDLFKRVPDDLPVDEARIVRLIGRGTALALAVEEWSQIGVKVISRGDVEYPDRFKKRLKGGAAPILYYAGDLTLLDRPTISVVGSRDATNAGLFFANAIGQRAAEEDIVTVSGDARGVDRAAMEGALDAGGAVIGILSDSMSKSVLSKRYRGAIRERRLLLLSHVEPDARFTVGQAMERNRYLYTAADAVIVADSDIKGGTWSGALENVKRRWTPAYVRQGSEQRPGNLALLGEGLIGLDDTWLYEGKSLRSLFEGQMPTRDTLPLFETSAEKCGSEIVADAIAGQGAGPKIEPDSHANGSADARALFTVFVDRLNMWLAIGSQTTDLIAARFSLDRSQVERWLIRAKSEGMIAAEGDSWRALEGGKS